MCVFVCVSVCLYLPGLSGEESPEQQQEALQPVDGVGEVVCVCMSVCLYLPGLPGEEGPEQQQEALQPVDGVGEVVPVIRLAAHNLLLDHRVSVVQLLQKTTRTSSNEEIIFFPE